MPDHAIPPDAVLRQRRTLLPTALLRLASDERLVEQVRAGSERAFEVLFDRHHRPVLAFCRHMLGSREEAEDAVQHAFLAAYRDIVGSQKTIALRPWLYAIARHRCLSILRARRDRPTAELPEPATEQLAAEVGRREDLRALLRDVARLPDDQRAALVLAELGDASHEDIGRILGCPREKVKALVFQARTSLAAARAAREIPCAEIRQQLATLRGGALRRTPLRRHLRDCAGCRAFHAEVRAQRRDLALLLPVAPSVGLKRAVLGAVFGSGGGAAGTVSALGGGSVATKALIAVALAGGGTAAGVTAARDGHDAVPMATPAVAAPRGAAASAGAGRTPPAQLRRPAASARADVAYRPAVAKVPRRPDAEHPAGAAHHHARRRSAKGHDGFGAATGSPPAGLAGKALGRDRGGTDGDRGQRAKDRGRRVKDHGRPKDRGAPAKIRGEGRPRGRDELKAGNRPKPKATPVPAPAVTPAPTAEPEATALPEPTATPEPDDAAAGRRNGHRSS